MFQNALTTDQISEEQKNQLIQNVRSFEKITELVPSTYFENEECFGFVWDDFLSYVPGAFGVVYAVLAQTTREPIKTAAEMSSFNTVDVLASGYDISCEEEFRPPRRASIIIIVVAVIFRLILIFLPGQISSVEYVFKKSEENPA